MALGLWTIVLAMGWLTAAMASGSLRPMVASPTEAGVLAAVAFAGLAGLADGIRDGREPTPYGGVATCYVEFGGGPVARVDVDFLSGSAPTGGRAVKQVTVVDTQPTEQGQVMTAHQNVDAVDLQKTDEHRKELQRDVYRIRIYYWKRGFREATVDTTVVKTGDRTVEVTFSSSRTIRRPTASQALSTDDSLGTCGSPVGGQLVSFSPVRWSYQL